MDFLWRLRDPRRRCSTSTRNPLCSILLCYDFMRAAKAESAVASLKTKDERNQIIQDAALSYAELAKWEQRLTRLQDTETAANQMQAAVAERVKEGVDSEIEGTKARLSAARVRLRIAEAQGAADVLREHLSKLTGLPAANIQTGPGLDSRATCDRHQSGDAERRCRIQSLSPSRRRACPRPISAGPGRTQITLASVDFAAQYALLSKFNNFQNYYIPSKPCTTPLGEFLCVTNNFQQNNATVGVSIRFPLFNASQRSRAQAADADALKATKQAEAARNQVSEETLRLQRSVAQMQAARDVAQLEYEIAQKNTDRNANPHGCGHRHAPRSRRCTLASQRTLHHPAGCDLRTGAKPTRTAAFHRRSGKMGARHALG